MVWNIPQIGVKMSDDAIASSCAGCGIANYVRPSEAAGGSMMIKTKLWEVQLNSGYGQLGFRLCAHCLGLLSEKCAEAKGKAGG